ncbi:hypothetical protein NFI96_017882 [Prochilodus magdalenae]|nr:hypothetical protein NFI96_017882 [Prochilodus magdalenae]
MALMGVQLVVSLLAVSIMQKMAPHCSFARWLLCNGSLFRFKHPSEGELCTLAGKQMPNKTNRRDRRQNGHGEPKPLTVPKDIDLHLESTPVNVLDALVLRFFVEYQWLIDFAVYAMGIYLFTEGYYFVVDASKEVNIGAIWCVLMVFFGLRTLHVLMSHYFRSDEGGERSVCLAFGFLSLLVAMLVLVVREDYLEFGLEPGFTSVFDNFETFAKQQGFEWSIPFTKLGVKLGLAILCAFLGALLAFPGLRLAQTHLDAVQMNAERPIIQILLHTSFLSPLVILVLWVKPLARDFLGNAPMGKTSVTLSKVNAAVYQEVLEHFMLAAADQLYGDADFIFKQDLALCATSTWFKNHGIPVLNWPANSPDLNPVENLWGIVKRKMRYPRPNNAEELKATIRATWALITPNQCHRLIDSMPRHISAVTRVYCYLTVVTLQYLIPILLVLFSTLALKSLGDYSWGLGAETPGVTPAPVLPTPPSVPRLEDEDDVEDMEEDIQATVAHLSEAFAALRAVLTPVFFRGVFAFLTWWVSACQLISSLFGIYFHQYLMQS